MSWLHSHPWRVLYGNTEPIESGGLIGHSLRRPRGCGRRGHDYRTPPRRLRGIGGCAGGKSRSREARSSEQQRKAFHAASFGLVGDLVLSPSPVPRRRPPLPWRPYSCRVRRVKRRAYVQRAASPTIELQQARARPAQHRPDERDPLLLVSPMRGRRFSTSGSSLLAPKASSAARSVIAGDRARVDPVRQWDACWKQATSYCATTCVLPELSPPWLSGLA